MGESDVDELRWIIGRDGKRCEETKKKRGQIVTVRKRGQIEIARKRGEIEK